MYSYLGGFMAKNEKIKWNDFSDGANVLEDKRGFKRHEVMAEIRKQTEGMTREQERAFVTEVFDRSKNI